MNQTIEQLAENVTAWCLQHRVVPANGQVATDTQPRTLRYYRTLGVLDAPASAGGYTERHFLQACAVRVLQAQGLPLARIQSLLFGRGDDELRGILDAAAKDCPPVLPPAPAETAGTGWQTLPLGPDFLLVSRRPGLRLSQAQIRNLLHILNSN